MEVVNKLRDAAVVALKDRRSSRRWTTRARRRRAIRRKSSPREIKEQYDWAKDVVKKQNIKLD